MRELGALRADSPRADEPLTYFVRLVGPPTRETLERYREAGVEHVVVSGGPLLTRATSTQQRADAICELTSIAHELG